MTKVSEKIEPANLPFTKLKVLWALEHLISKSKDRFSIKQIVDCLVEEKGIDVSRQLVRSILDRTRGAVNSNKGGFKLMEAGRKELEKYHTGTEDVKKIDTIVIEPGKPFTTKNAIVKDILKDQTGEIRICDAYVDFATLAFIHQNFSNKNPIKILTTNIKDVPKGTISQALKDLKTEGFNIELRIYTASILHDRYIIDDKHLWISGNSFNGIGIKESFIHMGNSDVRQSMLGTFNSRFKTATVFT